MTDLRWAPDAELLERAQAGDPAAFNVLADRHRPAALRVAAGVVGRANPQEVATAAFDRVWSAIRSGDGLRESFQLYLYRTVRLVASEEVARRRVVTAPRPAPPADRALRRAVPSGRALVGRLSPWGKAVAVGIAAASLTAGMITIPAIASQGALLGLPLVSGQPSQPTPIDAPNLPAAAAPASLEPTPITEPTPADAEGAAASPAAVIPATNPASGHSGQALGQTGQTPSKAGLGNQPGGAADKLSAAGTKPKSGPKVTTAPPRPAQGATPKPTKPVKTTPTKPTKTTPPKAPQGTKPTTPDKPKAPEKTTTPDKPKAPDKPTAPTTPTPRKICASGNLLNGEQVSSCS